MAKEKPMPPTFICNTCRKEFPFRYDSAVGAYFYCPEHGEELKERMRALPMWSMERVRLALGIERSGNDM